MDAFRLLTRSTKLKVGGPQRPSSNQLPSAGKAENPQLFPDHQHEGGKKRKRGDAGEEGMIAEDILGLNFFAPRKAAPQEEDAPKGKKNKNKKKNQTAQEQPEDADPVNEEEEPPMLEDERKALLKSHKIKITDMRVLEKPEPEPAKDSKKKRKKSKQKEERSPVMSKRQRKEAQRLYPQPLMRFQELRSRYRISRRLAGNVFNQGYSMPTEVQLGTLPLQLGVDSTSTSSTNRISDPDLLVVAPTGSGKTIAFLIPLINKIIVHHHENPDFRGLLSIVVAPTKELASQIVNEGRKLVVGTGVRITAMKKGMRVVERGEDDEKQILDEGSDSGSDESDEGEDEFKKPASRATITKSDILVTTPLQLINSLSDNQTKSVAPLPTVRNLVLDEADVLLDPLFREQTLGIWRACTHAELRVGLWSATMGSNIEELTKSTIKEREDSLGLSTTAPLLRLVVGLKDSAIPNITHKLTYAATEQGKLLGLRQLLHPTTMSDDHLRPPFLVFTQTIPRAVALHSELLYDIPAEAGGSSRIAVLHSDLSDQQRSDVMTGFRKGEIWILITTDLLARGVDFRGINGVVNYDIPNSSASYVHRVGRTGRAGRQGGIAVTFYTKEDIPYVKNIANVIAASEKLRGEGGTKSVEKWLLDALPDLSKKDKKDLKRHGVQARRSAVKLDPTGKGKRKMQISTKSGFERRMENKRKGAVQGSRRRKAQEQTQSREGHGSGADEEWGGIEE